MTFDYIKFDENGLVSCVAQDVFTGEVLMLAYVNKESLSVTLETGFMTYFSRSRQELWFKGNTSGNKQKIVSLKYDCDGDTLLAIVEQSGVACHTGEKTCFFKEITKDGVVDHSGENGCVGANALLKDYVTIIDRMENPQEGSYTNYLLDKGVEKICKKVGEESSEIIIAAMKDDNEELICEVSDFMYHVSVLMASKGIKWEDIFEEIEKRRK